MCTRPAPRRTPGAPSARAASRRPPELTIHTEHPFQDPHPDGVRRLRARVGAAVSLWTSGTLGADAAGLTVSSWLVVAGEPGRLVAAIDPDSDLYERFEQTGRAVMQLLTWPDRQLAEAFAGTAPAPGGPFRAASFLSTPAGPRLEGATTWAEVAWETAVSVGWSMLVTATVTQLEVGDGSWLVHRRGRYERADGHRPPTPEPVAGTVPVRESAVPGREEGPAR